MLDNSKFAGNYNIPNIIKIKVYKKMERKMINIETYGGIEMKVITLCGSLKFKKEMMKIAEKMALEGYCVFTPAYPVSEN